MAWVTPSTRTTGTLITAAIWNADVRANPIALYGGAMSVSSQAQYDLLQASSATQLARIAGVANAVLVTDGSKVPSLSTTLPAVDGSALTGISVQLSLLVADSGSTSSTSAENVDTIAISGLTSKDRLLVYVAVEYEGQTGDEPILYNTTDSVAIHDFMDVSGASPTAGSQGQFVSTISQLPSANTKISAYTRGRENVGTQGDAIVVSTFTTAWTGSWTLALRHGGVTAGGTFRWSWSVFKVAGQ